MPDLGRLLRPATIAVYGGGPAAAVIEQCRGLGFTGQIWPVHPHRERVAGLATYVDTASLPEPPDAAFVAVPAAQTVEVVRALARRGAGGAVCHASGFGETGEAGRTLQEALVAAAGDMAIIGPNCMGVLNYVDAVSLWPEQHGGAPCARGVAIITQSGNIAQNLTMQRRDLPIAKVMAVGNGIVTSTTDLLDAMIADSTVTAVGLHLEHLPSAHDLLPAAHRAAQAGKPVIALRTGRSVLGARSNQTHTGALAGPDALSGALLQRAGIAEVTDLSTFVETLKLLHVLGVPQAPTVVSASCSGGEAALVADTADRVGVTLPVLPPDIRAELADVLGDRVAIGNPLDYHTYIWGDRAALERCFTALLGAEVGVRLLVLDLPRDDRCDSSTWETTLDALMAAHRAAGTATAVVSSLVEGLPEAVRRRLTNNGIAPMQGMAECLRAIRVAADAGRGQRALLSAGVPDLLVHDGAGPGGVIRAGDPTAREFLAAAGVRVPRRVEVQVAAAAQTAAEIGFPVVVKTGADLAHKTEAGGVAVGLATAVEVGAAADSMAGLGPTVAVEEMVGGAVAELLVGVRREARYGLVLTLGAGGVTTELTRDTRTLVVPDTPDRIAAALRELRMWPLLDGFRGRPVADVDAVVSAVTGLVATAAAAGLSFAEVEINPLVVLPRGHGCVAVDSLLFTHAAEGTHDA